MKGDGILSGWRFPVAALSVLLFGTLASAAMLLVPPGDSPLHAFAEEFRVWCFGWDPVSGKLDTTAVVLVVTDPLLLAAVIVGVWWRPLREARPTFRRTLPWVAGAGAFVVLAGVTLAATWTPAPRDGDLPFPAERLRTSIDPPSFALTDQDGAPVALADFAGRVVVLTGVYSTCGHTCPLILTQVKHAVDAVPEAERSKVTVLAVSLDPANDTPARMKHMAENHGITAPQFRLLTGAPAEIDPVLDRLGIERRRNPETGVIDHANLFAVVDARGKIAYRLTLGERQERWLTRAMEHLAREVGEPRG